jgi:hypothetical protein
VRAGVLGGWCVGLWVVVQLLGSASAAAAELSIATPAACAVADELTFRTERALGQPIESAAAVRCTIHIARSAGLYAARMEVETIGSGRPSRLRSFLAPTCAKLTETLALAVVLAIGAGPEDGAAGASDPPAAGPAGSGSEASQAALAVAESSATLEMLQADTPARTSDDTQASSGQPNVAASAALVGDAGSLPGAGLGVSLGAALGGELLELRLLGTYLPAREASIETSSGSGGVEIGLLAGSLAGCLPRLLRASRLELGVCAGAELGWLSGNGTGVDISRSGGTLWTALRADAAARWALGDGFALDLLFSALVPTDRDEFTISEVGPVFQTGTVVGRASLGVSFAFGGPDSDAR